MQKETTHKCVLNWPTAYAGVIQLKRDLMELKDFVKESLTQIAQGINESIEEVRESGGYVNPASRVDTKNTDSSHFSALGEGRNVFLVDFDIAVSVEEKEGTKAEAKLKVASILSLGAGGNSDHKSSATNRISFKVPLALPVDPISANELVEREKKRKQESDAAIARSRRSPRGGVV
jgi:hypothetical protein